MRGFLLICKLLFGTYPGVLNIRGVPHLREWGGSNMQAVIWDIPRHPCVPYLREGRVLIHKLLFGTYQGVLNTAFREVSPY